MGGVDHDRIRLTGPACQLGEDAVEHPQPAPTDEAVVDGLVRTLAFGCIAPHQPMLDNVNDTRHDPPVINSRDTMRKREKRLDPAHLRTA